MTPWESLAPWVLFLVEESNLLYMNSDYKKLGYKIYTTIFKNYMLTTLDAIIGVENQSAAIKTRAVLHTFSTIRIAVDVSNKLNSNLVWIFVNLLHSRLGFHALFKFGYGDKFIQKIEAAYTNIQSKTKKMVSYLNLLPLYQEFTSVSTLI